jgi:CubicO group peptidase (beta-lactamase class C family)
MVAEVFDAGLIPGVAVAVVTSGGIVWESGFGMADREAARPVTEQTRFYIASTTKALTALAAARLAERGALDLDAPLSRAFPGLTLAEGLDAGSIRVVDLLTHTHGMDGEGPISLRVAFSGEYTNDELLRLVALHRAAEAGRAFQYSNLGYDLAGILLAPSKTRGWTEVVEREVTEPLGMTATTAWRSRVPEDLLAQPYEMGPEGFERIRLAKEDANMGPAGGHFSTAHDLARLLVAELGGGRVDGVQALPANVIAETQTLRATQDRDFAFFHRHGWGLGWDLGTYDGDTLIHRFGSFPGYRSHVSFMPGRDLGVVVLTNGGNASSKQSDIIAAAIYDRMLGRPDARERLAQRLADSRAESVKMSAAIAADRAKRAARSQELPHPLSAYAGTYDSPVLGTLELKLAGERLEAVMGVARSRVEVFDGTKNQLRVELFGRGNVIAALFPEGAESARAVTMLDMTFTRR